MMTSSASRKTEASSLLSNWNPTEEIEEETNVDYSSFEKVFASVCKKYNFPDEILVKVVSRDDSFYRYLMGKTRKPTQGLTQVQSQTSEGKTKSVSLIGVSGDTFATPPVTVIVAVYNDNDTLAELLLKDIPSLHIIVMQVIGILGPLQTNLTKITISGCGVDLYTIMELSYILSATTVTDVYLESLTIPEANYSILLEVPSNLKHLAITRCGINDVVCEELASKLCISGRAGKTLIALNLSSNNITDVGIQALSEALRTNRTLRHLNLANNRITDVGGALIFNVLQCFPISKYEVTEKRRRILEELQRQMRYVEEMKANGDRGGPRRRNTGAIITDSLDDPFSDQYVKMNNGKAYCMGNFVLCYLNLAFNSLTILSLELLLSVLKYQSTEMYPNDIGIMKIEVVGNNIPRSCITTEKIILMLQLNLMRLSSDKKSQKKN